LEVYQVLERPSTTLIRRVSLKDGEDFKVREEAEEGMIGRGTRGRNLQTSQYPGIPFPDVNLGFWYIQSWGDDSYTIPRKIRAIGEYQTS
jgi:hypothetical protein